MRILRFFTCLPALFLAFSTVTAEQPDKKEPAVAKWDSSVHPDLGFRIGSRFGDFSVYSRITLVGSPGWNFNDGAPKLVRFNTDHTSVKAENGNGTPKTMRINQFREAHLKDFTVVQDNSQWTMKVKVETNKLPCVAEYTALFIPNEILPDGGELKWTAFSGKSHSIPLPTPVADSQPTLADDIRQLELTTRFGTLRIEVESGVPFEVRDCRAKKFSYTDLKGLWIGACKTMKKVGDSLESNIRFSIGPAADPAGAKRSLPPAASVEVPRSEVSALNRNIPVPKLMFPEPKSLRNLPGDDFVCTGGTIPVRLGGEYSPLLNKAVRRLLENAPKLTPEFGAAGKGIEILPDSTLKGNDAYTLSVSTKGIVIRAVSERAAFYALRTLLSRFENGVFAGVEISDYADMALRGVHMYLDKDSLAVHGKMIEEVFAPLKINFLLTECEYVKWDATAGFQNPNGMSKEDLVKLLEIARENYIEVAPLLPTFGHCEWLFNDGKNLDLADDPNLPYDYNVAAPRLYPLIQRLLDEIVGVFKPRYLHIGHDEIRLAWKKPFRKELQGKDVKQIIRDDIMWYYRYAKENNLRMMMWHDPLIGKNEVSGRYESGFPEFRKTLPKDIVICYWDYAPHSAYRGADLVSRAGFELIGAGWFRPGNLETLAPFCAERNALGFITTTWTGFFASARSMQSMFNQISPYVSAGILGWNAKTVPGSWNPNEMLLDLLRTHDRPEPSFAGTTFDLSNKADVLLTKANDPFGNGKTFGLDQLPAKPFRAGSILFQPLLRDGAPAGITLRSYVTPDAPRLVWIPIRTKAKALYFLHTVREPIRFQSNVALYVVEYDDKTRIQIPIRFGLEIVDPFTFNQSFSHLNAWSATPDGRDGLIRWFKWVNPHPEKTIQSVTLADGNYAHPPILLGISAAKP